MANRKSFDHISRRDRDSPLWIIFFFHNRRLRFSWLSFHAAFSRFVDARLVHLLSDCPAMEGDCSSSPIRAVSLYLRHLRRPFPVRRSIHCSWHAWPKSISVSAANHGFREDLNRSRTSETSHVAAITMVRRRATRFGC